MDRVAWLLALRYLRASVPRSNYIFVVPLILAVLLGLLYGADELARHAHDPRILGFHADWARAIGNAKWIGSLVFVLAFTFVVALRWLTIFTTFSTYGMFVGCAALVIVLSVMSGFEADIKHKILGTHAHVLVTRVDEAFTEWPEKLAQVKATPGVLAVSPVLSSEAMIASPSNRSNVVVQGIDPPTIGSVTDLSRNLEIGDLDSLVHPENIKLPEIDRPDDDDNDDDLRIHGDDKPKPVPKIDPQQLPPPKGGTHALDLPPGYFAPPKEAARRAPPGIIVGRELAKSLKVYIGDDVSMVSPTGGIGPTGATPKARPYRVAGIFFSGMFEYDSKFVYISLPAAQKLFDQADEVSELQIKVPNSDHTDVVVAALAKALGAGYEVTDWKSQNSSLFSALSLEKVVMFVFLSFIILVAAFSIVSNGQMLATQKMGEIAILKSMGATDGTIGWAFMILGLMLGLFGVLAGVGGGLFGAYALQKWGYALDPDVFYLTELPVRFEPSEIQAVCIAGVLVTILATVQPAWRASRMTPVEGLREGGH